MQKTNDNINNKCVSVEFSKNGIEFDELSLVDKKDEKSFIDEEQVYIEGDALLGGHRRSIHTNCQLFTSFLILTIMLVVLGFLVGNATCITRNHKDFDAYMAWKELPQEKVQFDDHYWQMMANIMKPSVNPDVHAYDKMVSEILRTIFWICFWAIFWLTMFGVFLTLLAFYMINAFRIWIMLSVEKGAPWVAKTVDNYLALRKWTLVVNGIGIGVGLLTAFTTIFGAAYGYKNHMQRVPMVGQAKTVKDKIKDTSPFVWIALVLSLFGIGSYIAKGKIPAKVKDGFASLGYLKTIWTFFSGFISNICDYFEMEHPDVCTCKVCAEVDEVSEQMKTYITRANVKAWVDADSNITVDNVKEKARNLVTLPKKPFVPTVTVVDSGGNDVPLHRHRDDAEEEADVDDVHQSNIPFKGAYFENDDNVDVGTGTGLNLTMNEKRAAKPSTDVELEKFVDSSLSTVCVRRDYLRAFSKEKTCPFCLKKHDTLVAFENICGTQVSGITSRLDLFSKNCAIDNWDIGRIIYNFGSKADHETYTRTRNPYVVLQVTQNPWLIQMICGKFKSMVDNEVDGTVYYIAASTVKNISNSLAKLPFIARMITVAHECDVTYPANQCLIEHVNFVDVDASDLVARNIIAKFTYKNRRSVVETVNEVERFGPWEMSEGPDRSEFMANNKGQLIEKNIDVGDVVGKGKEKELIEVDMLPQCGLDRRIIEQVMYFGAFVCDMFTAFWNETKRTKMQDNSDYIHRDIKQVNGSYGDTTRDIEVMTHDGCIKHIVLGSTVDAQTCQQIKVHSFLDQRLNMGGMRVVFGGIMLGVLTLLGYGAYRGVKKIVTVMPSIVATLEDCAEDVTEVSFNVVEAVKQASHDVANKVKSTANDVGATVRYLPDYAQAKFEDVRNSGYLTQSAFKRKVKKIKEMTQNKTQEVHNLVYESTSKRTYILPNARYNVYNWDADTIITVNDKVVNAGSSDFIKYIDELEFTKRNNRVIVKGKNKDVDVKMSIVKVDVDPVVMKPQGRDLEYRDNKVFRDIDKPLHCIRQKDQCFVCGKIHTKTSCDLNLVAIKQLASSFMPENMLSVKSRMNVANIHNRMFKIICDSTYRCTGFLFGDSLITTYHGIMDDKALLLSSGNSGVVQMVTPKNAVLIHDDLIKFKVGGHSGIRIPLAKPKDGEPCVLFAFDDITSKSPEQSIGFINSEGWHSCPSKDGNCGGVIVNMDGAIIAIHHAGSKIINKAIPMTDDLIKVISSGF